MPKSKKGMRRVDCSGRVKLGPSKGLQCKRSKMLPVDEHNNTRLWYCSGHKK